MPNNKSLEEALQQLRVCQTYNEQTELLNSCCATEFNAKDLSLMSSAHSGEVAQLAATFIDRLPASDEKASLIDRINSFWTTSGNELDNDPQIQQIRAEYAALENKAIPASTITLSNQAPQIIVHGDLTNKQLALTFDDGPHPQNTPIILDALTKFGVSCNFFQMGQNADRNPEPSRSVVTRGHIVGSHTYTHSDLTKLAENAAELEITNGKDAVVRNCGQAIPFFRFPYGAATASLKNFVRTQLRLNIFFWSIDTRDWDFKGHNFSTLETFRAISSAIESNQRGVVLMHDIQPQTAAVLPDVLRYIRLNGYSIVQFT